MKLESSFNFFFESTKMAMTWDIWRSLYVWWASFLLVIVYVFTSTDMKSVH